MYGARTNYPEIVLHVFNIIVVVIRFLRNYFSSPVIMHVINETFTQHFNNCSVVTSHFTDRKHI